MQVCGVMNFGVRGMCVYFSTYLSALCCPYLACDPRAFQFAIMHKIAVKLTHVKHISGAINQFFSVSIGIHWVVFLFFQYMHIYTGIYQIHIYSHQWTIYIVFYTGICQITYILINIVCIVQTHSFTHTHIHTHIHTHTYIYIYIYIYMYIYVYICIYNT